MASKTLALNSPELLAEYVRQSELKGFFEKRLATPPDHMAMLIKDGEIKDTYKGAHFSIGGIFKSLKTLIVGSSHVSILLADLKPFSLQTGFNAITKDDVPVFATATFELQINPDKPANVMGLVNTQGFLTREEVLARFRPHLCDRVIEAAVRRVNADEIRGERGLQDHIQAEMMREVERLAGDLGLIVRAVSMEWPVNEVEREAMEKSILDREQTRMDQELDYLRRNIARTNDAKAFRIESDLDLAKFEDAKQTDLVEFVLNNEVRLIDARLEIERRQELEALGHEIKVLREERTGKFENRIAEANHAIDAEKLRKGLRVVQIEIDELDQKHLAAMKRMNAFSDQEILERQKKLELEIAERAQKTQRDHIAALQKIENDGEDAQTDRDIRHQNNTAKNDLDRIKVLSDARTAELNAGARMTPEQTLAVNAANSDASAKVMIEQARASAGNNDQVIALMRENMELANDARQSANSQAQEMFRVGMEGAGAVAQGAGGGKSSSNRSSNTSDSHLECPNCGNENTVKNRFCIGCGHQMRT